MSGFSINMDFRETPTPRKSNDEGDGADSQALTVSQLTRRIKSALEGEFKGVYLEAEIGSISAPPSGHIYLTLKDEKATLDAVIWRSSAARLGKTPTEGDKVLVRGDITVYEPRGRYQMVISSLRPAGEGELRNRFEQLVRKLREEGLFDPEHKKELPQNPQAIGVVTSASGAAVQDIIKVIKKRMPMVSIIVSPCVVQGSGAPGSIVQALERLERYGGVELIILGRGGGSLEDLQAFNDESVARAVFECATPVISAVGHEVDISVCDLVADARAATPSEAAEMAVDDVAYLRSRIAVLKNSLQRSLMRELAQARQRLNRLSSSPLMLDPMRMLRGWQQQFDELSRRFAQCSKSLVTGRKQELQRLAQSFAAALKADTQRRKYGLGLIAARLEGLSPLAVLGRGYSVTRDADNKVITSADDVKVDDEIHTILAGGRLVSKVMATGE